MRYLLSLGSLSFAGGMREARTISSSCYLCPQSLWSWLDWECWGALCHLATLYPFRRGGSLDAQVLCSGSHEYANYIYSVYLGAAGRDLRAILSSADAFGKGHSPYPSKTGMSKDYPHILQ